MSNIKHKWQPTSYVPSHLINEAEGKWAVRLICTECFGYIDKQFEKCEEQE